MRGGNNLSKACCFLGHRTICENEELKTQLYELIEKMIKEENVKTFIFGSKSQFNSLCYDLVSKMKEKYPDIKRVYVRGEYPIITYDYKEYLLKSYEETYYPEKLIGATRSVYIKRNYEMIDQSKFCVFYYDKDYSPKGRNSGTKIALDYAMKKNKIIYLFQP